MKVIFLDIDGVLNYEELFKLHAKVYRDTGLNRGDISETAVSRLAEIVERTGAQLVISSSWRGAIKRYSGAVSSVDIRELLRLFAEYHLEILDYTMERAGGEYADGTSWSRGYEVREWLSRHPEVDEFVMLDDEEFRDWYELKEKLVLTDFYGKGLQDSHVEHAIQILGGI